MIKIIFKNDVTANIDGDCAENEKNGAFLILKKEGREIGLVAISEIKALFVDDSETDSVVENVERESDYKWEQRIKELIGDLKSDNVRTLNNIGGLRDMGVVNKELNDRDLRIVSVRGKLIRELYCLIE